MDCSFSPFPPFPLYLLLFQTHTTLSPLLMSLLYLFFSLSLAGAFHPPSSFPLFCSCLSGHKEIVLSLIDNGADVNMTDNLQRTAISLTCVKKRQSTSKTDMDAISIIGELMRRGADVNRPDNYGKTPLLYLASNQDVDESIIEELLEGGADIGQKDKKVRCKGELRTYMTGKKHSGCFFIYFLILFLLFSCALSSPLFSFLVLCHRATLHSISFAATTKTETDCENYWNSQQHNNV